MTVTIIVNSSPYGTEGPYNALRLADALRVGGQEVELFLMGDGVHTARRGQDPRGAHASLETMLEDLIDRGIVVTCCGTCCGTRGLAQVDLIEGSATGTIHDLAKLIGACDRVVSF
jgi:uncharacterized protein involved in oxidation of intracellular sulfur